VHTSDPHVGFSFSSAPFRIALCKGERAITGMSVAASQEGPFECFVSGHMQIEIGTKIIMAEPTILILGTRGVPAAHGGFETLAEKLALFLAARRWRVCVYCQEDVPVVRQRVRSEYWRGIERICIQVSSRGPLATLEFDWHSIRDAATRDGVCLVLGYNGAALLPYLRIKRRKIITNMDGIEWLRPKWSLPVKAWFWLNEWIAAWTSHRLIADHPVIATHLATRGVQRKTVTIAYGGSPVYSAPVEQIYALGLVPDRYFVSIARIEPDNSILDIVEAFSRKRRGAKLVVLGTLNDDLLYHRKIRAAASEEVIFPGAIYDANIVQALRFYARAYVHGHRVGGTNPSLVEALWAGNAAIAYDNAYNRWTAAEAGVYFNDADSCAQRMEEMLTDNELVISCRHAARWRARMLFRWPDILSAYEREALALLDASAETAGFGPKAAAKNPW
jgi:glycosyltransferase involved in cell wall biosynthesis